MTEKTFGELKIGERFHYNIDADGYEPYLYKVSDTEGYVEHGSSAGQREQVAVDETVYTWSEPIKLNDHITEIERAALTLLHPEEGAIKASHIGLWKYIWALSHDENEMRDLDTFIWEADVPAEGYYDDDGVFVVEETASLREMCKKAGDICWRDEPYEHDNSALLNLLDHDHLGQPKNDDENRLREMDEASVRLADAIHEYRYAGRPDGDQSHTISGMGSPLMRVTTSLAAAVTEYHSRICNDYATRLLHADRCARKSLKRKPEIPSSGVTSMRISGLENDLQLIYEAYGESGSSFNGAIRQAIRAEAARLRMIGEDAWGYSA